MTQLTIQRMMFEAACFDSWLKYQEAVQMIKVFYGEWEWFIERLELPEDAFFDG